MLLWYLRVVRGLPRTQHPYSTEAQLELPVSEVPLLLVVVVIYAEVHDCELMFAYIKL